MASASEGLPPLREEDQVSKIDDALDNMGITDPVLREMMRSAILAEMSVPVAAYVGSGGQVHSKEMCKASRKAGAPKGCVLHRPTLHKLTGAQQIMRSSTLIEDICAHGVGHPNPDSAAYLNWRDKAEHWGIHGCDGCCGPIPDKYDYLDGDYPA